MSHESMKNNESSTLEMLKEAGMNLDGYHNAIEGKQMQQAQELSPNTWNENSGIIAFVDGDGKFFAVPSTDRYRSALMSDAGMQKTDIGVPALGNPEIWHNDPKQGEEIPGFKRWQELNSRAEGIRAAEQETEQEPTLEDLGNMYKVGGDLPPSEQGPEQI